MASPADRPRYEMLPPGQGCRLSGAPHVEPGFLARVTRDYQRCTMNGPPDCWEEFLRNEYAFNPETEYAGLPIRNPWGKASGQLSMTLHQVEEDVAAGLGFVVLKTVIAQDQAGTRSMQAWAIREARMDVECITSATGVPGWTVTWKGRGWWQSFDEYLRLVRDACQCSREAHGRHQSLPGRPGTLIVPSCKYHLPAGNETVWRQSEYDQTTQALLAAWRSGTGCEHEPMPLEKDFSPTLAGSDLASARARILEWLAQVPQRIRAAVPDGASALRIGLKMFNALFDDSFQVDMLRAIHASQNEQRPDYFVYGNRLFDPHRVFDGHRGVAYGGPDLSDRNLRVLRAFQTERASDRDIAHSTPLPCSATGDITTGRMAIEYALCGATSFQLHTFFQLPAEEYGLKHGSRTQRALVELWLHPQTGFVVWLEHLRQLNLLPECETNIRQINACGCEPEVGPQVT